MGNLFGFIGYFLQLFFKNKKGLYTWFYRLAVKYNTKNPYALLSYGMIKLNEEKYQEADDLFERVLNIKGIKWNIDKIAKTDKSLTQWKLGNLDKAIEILESICEEYVRANVYATLAYFYIQKGDYEKAKYYNDKALKEEEDYYVALDNYGQLCFRQGDYENAKEYFLKALAQKSDLPDSLYHLGIIFMNEGDIESAERYLNKALHCDIKPLNTVTRQQVERKYEELQAMK